MRSSRRRRPTCSASPSSTCNAISSPSSCRVRSPLATEKTALVHDYLNQLGGAERVFRHIADAFPGAPVYTSLFEPQVARAVVDPARVHTSALQMLPFSQRYFRLLAPLYPAAFEAFDLSAYDLVVSSTTAWAKGVRVRPGATHVCYINTVSLFAFAYDSYVGGFGAAALARPAIAPLVAWDRRAAARPTAFVANSRNVAARVRRYYGREAYVLHCPVDVERFEVGDGSGGYYLVVSRLLPYKRVEVAIEACARARVPLRIVGSGPAEGALRAAAAGTRTEFLGALSDAELREVMGRARAVILPGEEDYGLVPLEANAAGRPALAYGRGGALETIEPGVTGEHFGDPAAASLAALLARFDPAGYDPAVLREHAERFGPERFKSALRAIVEEVRGGSAARATEELLSAST
ncbi:MAG: glycosyltransferase [Candidatus Baltobacteraceae bacterium]